MATTRNQRMNRHTADSTDTDGALLSTRASNPGSRSISTCTYCNKSGHLEAACWTKYPHLKPKSKGFIVKSECEATNEADEHICLPATTSLRYASPCAWVKDTEVIVHMSYNKAVFFKMKNVGSFDVEMGGL